MEPLSTHTSADHEDDGHLGQANRLIRILSAILLTALLSLIGTATVMTMSLR